MKFFFKIIIIKLFFILNFFFHLYAEDYKENINLNYDEIYDPFEPLNRSILDFNFFVDDIVISPVIKTYKSVTPEPLQEGVDNFFNNLAEPMIGISFFFQGDFNNFLNSTGRFAVNSITSLGFFDFASKIGMSRNETDMGLTLAKGGVSSGPYLVLPLIGPSNLRDFSSGILTYNLDPISNNIENRTYFSAVNGLNSRAQIDQEIEILDGFSIDRYELLKTIYFQNRNSQIEEYYIQNLPSPKI